MKTACFIIIAIFASVRFVASIVDTNNKRYLGNLLCAFIEFLAVIGCAYLWN